MFIVGDIIFNTESNSDNTLTFTNSIAAIKRYFKVWFSTFSSFRLGGSFGRCSLYISSDIKEFFLQWIHN